MALISFANIHRGVSRLALAHNITSDCHQFRRTHGLILPVGPYFLLMGSDYRM